MPLGMLWEPLGRVARPTCPQGGPVDTAGRGVPPNRVAAECIRMHGALLGGAPRVQDAEVGDGTTTVVLLAAEFLRECKAFVEEGVHPQVGPRGVWVWCGGVVVEDGMGLIVRLWGVRGIYGGGRVYLQVGWVGRWVGAGERRRVGWDGVR